jgi:hypothetical protein
MRKVLEALDNESTVVKLDAYIHDTVEIENIVRDAFDGNISAIDVTLEDNALTVKVLADTEVGEEVSDAVLAYLGEKANFDYDCEYNTSSVKVAGEQYIQSTINITATDSTVEKRKVVESFEANEGVEGNVEDIKKLFRDIAKNLDFKMGQNLTNNSSFKKKTDLKKSALRKEVGDFTVNFYDEVGEQCLTIMHGNVGVLFAYKVDGTFDKVPELLKKCNSIDKVELLIRYIVGIEGFEVIGRAYIDDNGDITKSISGVA